ncbi:MAG TPA: hypothetical protein ENH01_03760 [Nitrospirae bacterium]|nr:hypothetical protein [Nitrospirota bacterium]
MITEKAAGIKEQEIQDYANTVISIVKEGYKNGKAIHKIERDLFKKLLEMGHKALGLLIELCGLGDVDPSVRLNRVCP